MNTYTTASWKKWLPSGTLSQSSKSHLIGFDGNTLCGKVVPTVEVEVNYLESFSKTCECKGCMKSSKEVL